ncbi:MAG: siderophore-interacting protein [Methylobacterium mesophilicum]|nr:siderophore-interacting protein [Methylobacterium mesophilicum]
MSISLPPSRLRAAARVVLSDPGDAMRCLCDRFRDHAEVVVDGPNASIATAFGCAFLCAEKTMLRLEAGGDDPTDFAFVKLSMAEHILQLASDARIVWTGDGAAGTPLPYFREMRVAGTRQLTPHMRRVTLKGEDLKRFEGPGLHIRLLFPPEGSAVPQWPVNGEDGRPVWPAGAERPVARIYTIRRIDAARGEVDVDMVLHEGASSPGGGFAARARPGDVVGMTGPGGGTVGEADHYLLAGDETALPAISRILENLPETKTATVFVEVADAREEQAIETRAKVDLHWLHRNGAAPGSTTLLSDAVRDASLPEGRAAFAWSGTECEAFRLIRKNLRNGRGLSREEHLATAYWRRGHAGEDARKDG